jgi:hypothetical protein
VIEAQIIKGEWTDPDRGKVKLRNYAENWISQRPGLRPRTVDLYTWLLEKHITPYVGGVQLGKLSTAMIRQWRADLLGNGVSVSMAAKAYRLLRAVLTTAAEDDHIIPSKSMAAKAYRLLRAVLTTVAEDDHIIPSNPCRIRGANDEHPEERPVLAVAEVFDLADRLGRRPISNVRTLKSGTYLPGSCRGLDVHQAQGQGQTVHCPASSLGGSPEAPQGGAEARTRGSGGEVAKL